MTELPTLANRVQTGLAWSTINNLVLRFGGVLVGILLARMLSPEAFGLYAVGLTAQTILQTIAELGMSADLIKRGNIPGRAPTVATIGLVISTLLALITCIVAEPVASILGDPAGAPIIRVLSITLVLGGASAVPFAVAQREFMQKKQFVLDSAGLVVSTIVTLCLIAVGLGAMALAIGRVVAQACTTVGQFIVTRVIPRFGFDRLVARSVVSFGVPLAAANFLSWLLLNIDYMIVGNRGGALMLGFYVLAFNLSSWPTTVVGAAIRSVAFPAFSRLTANSESFNLAVVAATKLAWAASLPIGFCLAVLAEPLIAFIYGSNWEKSASPLVGLAIFGVIRVVFDVMASGLIARGDSRRILIIQVLWIAVLSPAMWFGMHWFGLAGAGWSHAVVAIACIYPAYLWSLARNGVSVRDLMLAALSPLLASIPAVTAAVAVSRTFQNDFLAVLTGGLTGVLTYGLLMFRWVQHRLAGLRSIHTETDSARPRVPIAGELV
jgi:lipopolysaccharide exporter